MSTTSSDDEDPKAIVIDNGSDAMKVGFSGDDGPRSIFPSRVGRPKVKNFMVGQTKDVYVGDEAVNLRGCLNLKRPLQQDIIQNWDDMEKIWHHSFFNELRVEPEDKPVLLTDNIEDHVSRAKMTEVMFETFKVPALLIKLQSVLALFSSGRSTGIVLNSGYETTSVTPIYDGKVVTRSLKHLEFGGKHITDYMHKMVAYGCCFSYSRTGWEVDMVNQMKEYHSYVAEESLTPQQLKEVESVQYELPDGTVIRLRNGEHVQAAEALFNPSLLADVADVNPETPGIHEALNTSIYKCFPDPHPKHFLPNIVLAGGNVMFKGLKERLDREMRKIISASHVAKVIAPPERKYSAWIGGSIFASLSTTDDLWITRAEYEDVGPEIVKQKCGSSVVVVEDK